MNFFRDLIDSSDDLLEFVRNDIILKKDTYYFDWTASGLESKTILNRMNEILPSYANTHSETSRNAKFISEVYLESKKKLKDLLELSDDFCIIPSGYGASGAMKKYQEINGLYISPKLKQILGLDSIIARQNLLTKYPMQNQTSKIASTLSNENQTSKNSITESFVKISSENSSINNFFEQILHNLPLIIVGPYEHHSNEISLREAFCKSIRIPLDGDLIDLRALREILENANSKNIESKHKKIFASLNIASNVSGIILPYELISSIFREYNASVAFDLASISPHSNIACDLFDSAFLSPHKLLGGIGSCGILCIRKDPFDLDLAPTFSGGGSIKYASKDSHYYIDDIESREDSGTPPILGLFKATLAYQYRNEIGLDFIAKREKILYEIMLNELRGISEIEVYGVNNDAKKLPIISFNAESISPYDLAYELSYNYNIETRAGCSCAGPYGHDLLNKDEIDINELTNDSSLKPSWLRVSLHYSHNFSDIEYFLDSIKKILKRK